MRSTTSPTDTSTARALRSAGYRVTPQRLVVHRTMLDLDRHVGAEELLGAVGERLPNVSLPTVYAALGALEHAGLVRRVPGSRRRALCDARVTPRHRLVCRRCGGVEDLDAEVTLGPALSSAGER